MGDIHHPTTNEIIEINKKIGCDGTLVNIGNLEFALDKAKNANTLMNKATILLCDMISGHHSLMETRELRLLQWIYF